MSDNKQDRGPDTGNNGLTRVLDAEQTANQRIADAHAQAEDLCQAAVAQEHTIATRTTRRITALHDGTRDRIEGEKTDLADAFEREKNAHANGHRPQDMDNAVVRLARTLVGLNKA